MLGGAILSHLLECGPFSASAQTWNHRLGSVSGFKCGAKKEEEKKEEKQREKMEIEVGGVVPHGKEHLGHQERVRVMCI